MIVSFLAREYELDQAHVTEQGFIVGEEKEGPHKPDDERTSHNQAI